MADNFVVFIVILIFIIIKFSPVVPKESEQIRDKILQQTESFLPNVVLLIVDDLKFSDLGCYGNKFIKTSNIDKLAKNGVLFTRWYAQATGTATRASILTGLLPTRTGMIRSKFLSFDSFPSLASSGGLHPGEPGLGSLAQIVGVSHSTAYIGNWDLGIGRDQIYLPMKHGFNFWYGVPAVHTRKCLETRQSNDQENGFLPQALWFVFPLIPIVGVWIAGRIYLKTIFLLKSLVLTIFYLAYLASFASNFIKGRSCVLFRNGKIIEQPFNVENMTLRFTREALKFIDSSRKKPFFLVLSYLHLHTPAFSSKPFAQGKEKHDEALQELDWSVGKILNFLKERRMENQTLIVLTADNGIAGQNISKIQNYLKQQNLNDAPTKSSREESYSGFKGRKRDVWESSLRAPTLIQWKGHIPEGQVVHAPVTSMDLFPTVLDAIGQNNSNTELDGKSLMPMLLNSFSASPHDFIFHYFDITRPAAITYGQYKVIFSTLTESDQTTFHDPPLLFDIESDPDENFPLSIEHFPQILGNVSRALEAHFSKRTNKWISQFDKPIMPLSFPCAATPSCYQENREQESYKDWFPDVQFHPSSVEYRASLEHNLEGIRKTPIVRRKGRKRLHLFNNCTKLTFLKLIEHIFMKRTNRSLFPQNLCEI